MADCIVCRKKFGLWARVSGDAADAVCRDCERTGRAALEAAAAAPANVPADERSLMSWAESFNEVAKRYQVSSERAGDLDRQLAENMIRWAARRPRAEETDVAVIQALADKFSFFDNPPEGFIQAARGILARLHLQKWDAGVVTVRDCAGLLLGDGEVCHWEEQAEMFEERTRRTYVGGSHGVSVRLARGLTYRVGAFKGTAMDTTELRRVSDGTLHITSERLAFTGPGGAVAIPYKKIISVEAYEGAFRVFRVGAKKPTILAVTLPEYTLQILGRATPATND